MYRNTLLMGASRQIYYNCIYSLYVLVTGDDIRLPWLFTGDDIRLLWLLIDVASTQTI